MGYSFATEYMKGIAKGSFGNSHSWGLKRLFAFAGVEAFACVSFSTFACICQQPSACLLYMMKQIEAADRERLREILEYWHESARCAASATGFGQHASVSGVPSASLFERGRPLKQTLCERGRFHENCCCLTIRKGCKYWTL